MKVSSSGSLLNFCQKKINSNFAICPIKIRPSIPLCLMENHFVYLKTYRKRHHFRAVVSTYLRADLVAALSSLQMHDLPHPAFLSARKNAYGVRGNSWSLLLDLPGTSLFCRGSVRARSTCRNGVRACVRLNATEPRSAASRRESGLRMKRGAVFVTRETHSCRRPELHSPEATRRRPGLSLGRGAGRNPSSRRRKKGEGREKEREGERTDEPRVISGARESNG